MGMQSSLSGYPEWLPEDRIVEQALVRSIQQRFELFGFAPIETRAIEPLSVLLAKGETDKEIYVLRRLQAAEDEPDKTVGLHFDLTVPFARYVMETRSKLVFPLRRYQIQKAWRGERPGLGRYREFLQADIDIIDRDKLTVYSDLEVIQVVSEIIASLPIPQIDILVNNRKILEGFYRALGITAITNVLRVVDKLHKIGETSVFKQLTDVVGLSEDQASKCLAIAKIRGHNIDDINKSIATFGVRNELLDEGLDELAVVLTAGAGKSRSFIFADLSIARGLDYYTGTVCEGRFTQFTNFPSVVAGGRYDNLVSEGSIKLPGVGISIGISRILGLVLHEGIVRASRKTPSCVLVALISDELRDMSAKTADMLRNRGIACEVFPRPVKYGKQIQYASRKGIPYVWFPDPAGSEGGEVRDIRTGTQVPANPAAWLPAEGDLEVQIVRDDGVMEKLSKDSGYR